MYICIPASVSARAVNTGRYDAAAAARYLESGAEDEAGSEDAFELLHEIGERVRAHCAAPSHFFSSSTPWGVGTLGTSTSGVVPGSTAMLCLGTRRAF
jgi:hypothetical protein